MFAYRRRYKPNLSPDGLQILPSNQLAMCGLQGRAERRLPTFRRMDWDIKANTSSRTPEACEGSGGGWHLIAVKWHVGISDIGVLGVFISPFGVLGVLVVVAFRWCIS